MYDNRSLQENIRKVTTTEEKFLDVLMSTLEKNWQDPEVTIESFCSAASLSQSQLYRKCVAIAHVSPNSLIREYRLLKALHLLRADLNVAQTTFEIGFTSPSYFTKCFQKRFGILPVQYLKM
jgi:AraC-like DNA-binding protein